MVLCITPPIFMPISESLIIEWQRYWRRKSGPPGQTFGRTHETTTPLCRWHLRLGRRLGAFQIHTIRWRHSRLAPLTVTVTVSVTFRNVSRPSETVTESNIRLWERNMIESGMFESHFGVETSKCDADCFDKLGHKWLSIRLPVPSFNSLPNPLMGLYSLSGRASYCNISWSIFVKPRD